MDLNRGTRQTVTADLIAVVIAATGGLPRVLTIREGRALPSGPFEPGHRSLQSGLRAWVERQTGHPLGYIEQLYTFADPARAGNGHEAEISISYFGLTREEPTEATSGGGWRSWYEFFPWEDHRAGPPQILPALIVPRLTQWAEDAAEDVRAERRQRVAIAFGLGDRAWNEELALQRYELLYEAVLVEEAARDLGAPAPQPLAGRAMISDHRRILATGIARLRAMIKYRPVVFELMPPTFTLLQLQRAVEALAGWLVHKQNFRRLIEQQALVEETGEISGDTGGRPAKLYRFRHSVLAERNAVGTRPPLARP